MSALTNTVLFNSFEDSSLRDSPSSVMSRRSPSGGELQDRLPLWSLGGSVVRADKEHDSLRLGDTGSVRFSAAFLSCLDEGARESIDETISMLLLETASFRADTTPLLLSSLSVQHSRDQSIVCCVPPTSSLMSPDGMRSSSVKLSEFRLSNVSTKNSRAFRRSLPDFIVFVFPSWLSSAPVASPNSNRRTHSANEPKTG